MTRTSLPDMFTIFVDGLYRAIAGGRGKGTRAVADGAAEFLAKGRNAYRGDRALSLVPPRTAKHKEMLEQEAKLSKVFEPVPQVGQAILRRAGDTALPFGDMVVRGVARVLQQLQDKKVWSQLSTQAWTEAISRSLVVTMNAAARKVAVKLRPSKTALLRDAASDTGSLSNVVGILREITGRDLPSIRVLVQGIEESAHKAGMEIIDSARLGVVRLFTEKGFFRLGTDRIVGIGKRYAKPVVSKSPVQGESDIEVVGSLVIELAVEVKSATTQAGGLTQIERLATRIQTPIIEIGGELWHAEYRIKDTLHVVVAPEATAGARFSGDTWAKDAMDALNRLNSAGANTMLARFPEVLDRSAHETGKTLLEVAERVAEKILKAQ